VSEVDEALRALRALLGETPGEAGMPADDDPRIWREVGRPLVAPTRPGPLSGMTIAVKDLFEVAGFRLGLGNPAFLGNAVPAERTASALQVLMDAGAAVRGIAQTDEFAYSIAGANAHYGTPPNGVVAGRLPGGSSSGPASAVAFGQATVGLGTDTAGSIRVPASYQALWGLRTTHGVVSVDGVWPLAPTFDTVGWLARDAVSLPIVGGSSNMQKNNIANRLKLGA
jgi:Asp-tRNA(Asn)/Glu-tRNA(Gln) amidotransferase A subunit family amidase